MSFRLRPSLFDAARPLLDRVHARGWIWRGQQELDGLCCVKAWFKGEDWIGALTPWLDHAAEVRETDGLVLLIFEKPVPCDCAQLGRALPLRKEGGALSSFHFVRSGLPASDRANLAGQLLIIDQGERISVPLGTFSPVDVAAWWSFEHVAAEEGVALSVKPHGGEPQSMSSTPFDPDGVDAGLEDVRDRIGRMRISPLRLVSEIVQHLLGGFARIMVWIFLIGLVVSVIAALGSGGDNGVIWMRIIVYAVCLGLYLLFANPSKRTIGPQGGQAGGQAAAGGGPVAMPDYRFGFFRRAAGWLFWNSAMAAGARDKYSQRLRELEKLFERGQLDEALRKAIALGGARKGKEPKEKGWFADFPLGGPGLRRDLNIRFMLGRVPAFGILTQGGFEHMRELYRKQAQILAEKGDFERAAFIHAELLNDPLAAVRLFERKGDFETAAKLAQGRRLAPSVFVPLWFKAGEKRRALRLAVQYDAFIDLLAELKLDDPFRKELVIAWSARLIETGDLLKALELTDKYAEMLPERRQWILRALERHADDAVLLARAFRCLPEADQERLQTLLQRHLAASGPDAVTSRLRLASRMADAAFEKTATDERYFSVRLPLLSLPLLRALLQDEAQYGSDKDRRDAALALSEASGQLALRVDLRRMNRVTATAAPPPVRHIMMRDAGDLMPVRDVVSVPGNRLLIAYKSGVLHLTALDGRRLWSDHIHNVRGFAPIGPGTMILVVRDELEGTALSLLDLNERTHRHIGFLDIQAFQGEATEIGWMVFSGGRVCFLDCAALIAAAKKGGGGLEHHWTVPITEPGRLCAFKDHVAEASFLYHRTLGSLLELWTLHKSTLQVECRFVSKDTRTPIPNVQTYGWAGGSYFHARIGDGAQIDTLALPAETYSLATERRLLREKQPWLLPRQSVSSPNLGPRSIIWCSEKPVSKPASVPSAGRDPADNTVKWFGAFARAPQTMFTVEFPGASQVMAHTHGTSLLASIFDERGRIAVVDLERARTVFRNDGGASDGAGAAGF